MLGIAGQGVLTGVESADGRRRRRALSGEGGWLWGRLIHFEWLRLDLAYWLGWCNEGRPFRIGRARAVQS
jgi:hypothetical protein